ncbi:MAG TPA: hypothetical protein DCR25_00560, partial [Rhodobacter sp.]|nr:hypothetical protein [Rhodobacter sp.]
NALTDGDPRKCDGTGRANFRDRRDLGARVSCVKSGQPFGALNKRRLRLKNPDYLMTKYKQKMANET